MRKILFAALAATLLFASCDKEFVSNDLNTTGESKKVYMKLAQGPSVRSVADVVNNLKVEFSSGHMFFVDITGNITKYFTITNNETEGNNLKISNLIDGLGGIAVPANSHFVYVVANLPSEVKLPTAGAYSGVEQKVITAASQAGKIESNAIKGIMLYSDIPGELKKSTEDEDVWTAVVTPRQIANRLQITDINAKPEAISHITSYTLEGIYVNNFYDQKTIGGVYPTVVDYGPSTTAYARGNGLYIDEGVFFDEPTGEIANSDGLLKVAAGQGSVWGYNLLAGNEVPRIIIKLKNIEVEEGYAAPVNGVGYITVKGFVDTGGKSIDFSKGGQVFTIAAGDLEFGLSDITTVPEMKSINAKVTVTLEDWAPVAVKPNI